MEHQAAYDKAVVDVHISTEVISDERRFRGFLYGKSASGRGCRGALSRTLPHELREGLDRAEFKKRGRIWYREGVNTIGALEFDDVSGAPEIWMSVWFKSKGEIDPAQVGPGNHRHLVQDLREALPKRMKWRLSHVLQPEMYSAAPDPNDPAKRSKWEKTFRTLLEDYAVAWFDRIEADPGAHHGWGRLWRRIRTTVGG